MSIGGMPIDPSLAVTHAIGALKIDAQQISEEVKKSGWSGMTPDQKDRLIFINARIESLQKKIAPSDVVNKDKLDSIKKLVAPLNKPSSSSTTSPLPTSRVAASTAPLASTTPSSSSSSSSSATSTRATSSSPPITSTSSTSSTAFISTLIPSVPKERPIESEKLGHIASFTADKIRGRTGGDLLQIILNKKTADGTPVHASHCKIIVVGKEVSDTAPLDLYAKDSISLDQFDNGFFRVIAPLPKIQNEELEKAIVDADKYCDARIMKKGTAAVEDKELVENARRARGVLERNIVWVQADAKNAREYANTAEKPYQDAKGKVPKAELDRLDSVRVDAKGYAAGIEDVVKVIEYQLKRLPK